VPKNELMPISKPQVSSSEIARQWLAKFAEICQKDITPALANIWAEQLGDIEPELLHRACDALMKKWDTGFLPVPGNVRAQAETLSLLARMEIASEQSRIRADEEHRRAIAYAEQKRQLPAPKPSEPDLPKIAPVAKPARVARVVDFEKQKKLLQKQADEILKRFPVTGREARVNS
jgi:hypothetical protein